MSQRTVFIATDEEHPDLFWDERPLLDHLAARSIKVIPAIWTDDSLQWDQADLVLVRCCWDSHVNPQRFLDWLHKVEQVTTVVNDPDTIRWGFNKTYLRTLEAAGVAVVPTYWVTQGTRCNLASLLSELQWPVALVKPSISADGYLTVKVESEHAASVEHGQQILNDLLVDRDVMVQPYVTEFDESRETSLIFVAGRFSHAYRRPSLLVHGEEQALAQRTVVQAPDALVALAERALSVVPPVMWARVDILDTSTPMINELEVVDPNLLMSFSPNGSCYEWLAEAVERKLEALT